MGWTAERQLLSGGLVEQLSSARSRLLELQHAVRRTDLLPEVFPKHRLSLEVARVDETRPLRSRRMSGPSYYLLQHLRCQPLATQTRSHCYISNIVGWMLIGAPKASNERNGFGLDCGDQLYAVAFGKDDI